MKRVVSQRLIFGAVLGAGLAPLVTMILSSGQISAPPYHVSPDLVGALGSAPLAYLVQSLLGGLFVAILMLATKPFADDGRELFARSLAHLGLTLASFGLLLWVCRWVEGWQGVLLWVEMLLVLYILVWLGRYVGWYMEVVQIRQKLGLAPEASPLKWRETLPYLPFLVLVCTILPAALYWVDATFVVDVPVFSGLIYPFLGLPVAGFCAGLSLGKRQGICPLFPIAAFLLYIPVVLLLLNASALIHCFFAAVPALIGNVAGAVYRKAVPKEKKRKQ